jgi:hypothetical protein
MMQRGEKGQKEKRGKKGNLNKFSVQKRRRVGHLVKLCLQRGLLEQRDLRELGLQHLRHPARPEKPKVGKFYFISFVL